MSLAQQLLIPHYGKVAVFSPLDVANLQFWLDGTDSDQIFTDTAMTTKVVNNNDAVAGWKDKTANLNSVTQSTAGVTPRYRTNIVNGLSVVELYATNRYMNFANLGLFRNKTSASVTAAFLPLSNFNTQHSLFTSTSPAGGSRFALDFGATAYLGRISGRRLDADAFQSTSNFAIPNSTIQAWQINTIKADWANTLIQLFQNGTMIVQKTDFQTAGATSNTNSQYIRVGNNAAGGNMYLAHVIGCVPAISTADRQLLEAWLASELAVNNPQVFCDGDSLTSGTGATAGMDYPSQLLTLLGASTWRKLNGGNSGDETTTLLTTTPQTADPQTSILRQKNVYVLWIGTNDLVNSGRSPADTYTNITTLITGRLTYGFQVVVCTVTPRAFAGDPADINTTIASLNALINANTAGADVVVDLAADARLDDPNDGTYFGADKLHLVNAGYAAVAGLVKTAIDTLPDLN